jgi:UDP-glucose 4-epimerase
MATKISIVGASGFIGNHLSKRLSQLHFKLELFDRKNPIVIGDKLDSRAINSEVIIWCASTVSPISAENNPGLANKELTYWQEFLNLMKSREEVDLRIFFLSSGGCTYTGDKIQFSETDEAIGTNKYGKLKLQMEAALINSGINSIILRIANVYGPGQPFGRGQGVIAEWVNSISRNEPITIYGDVNSFRDYIYIDDLLDAIVFLLESNIKNHKLNIGSGRATSLGELKDLFAELSNTAVLYATSANRNIDRIGYVLDISKVSQMASWTPRFTLRNGLRLCLR